MQDMAMINKLETPLLRVSRPVSACQRCRNAKVKCDGKLPACTACERAGRAVECSSGNDKFAKGKERSYVASLENRIEKLEKHVEQARARKAATKTLDVVAVPPSLPPISSGRSGGGKSRRKEVQDVNDLVSDFGYLSVNATARDFHGFTREMSFARLVLSTSSKEIMPTFKINLLPQRLAMTPLIEHYLEHFHTLYPFLTETKLFTAVNDVCWDNGRFASPINHWTTRMVLAIALASMSRKRGDTYYQDAVRHVAAALDNIESVVQPGSVIGIQAMLLLVLYAMLDPHHFNSWYLVGLASRAMVDIGLHQDRPKELRLADADRDIARRVYASIYSLDRLISMVHQRGFSFTDDSAGITSPLLPTRLNSSLRENQPFIHSLEAAVQMEHLRHIQSSAYQKLFQSSRPTSEDLWPWVSGVLWDMQRWFSNLPDQVKNSTKKLFRCDVLYSSILILVPPTLVGTLCDYGKFLILDFATEYAELMAGFAEEQITFFSCTHYDLLRASLVAERVIHALSADSALLFGGIIPKVPVNSDPPAGPFTIPARTVGEMVNRAHRCLDQLQRTLESLGPRFGHCEPLNEFKARSPGVRQTLQAIYSHWNRSLGFSRVPYMSLEGSVNGNRP